MGDGTPRKATLHTRGYQHPDAEGVVSATSDYYAVGQTVEELLNVC